MPRTAIREVSVASAINDRQKQLQTITVLLVDSLLSRKHLPLLLSLSRRSKTVASLRG